MLIPNQNLSSTLSKRSALINNVSGTTHKMSKLKTFGTGPAVGLVGSIASGISSEVFHTPLGYSPLSFKNFFKVGAISGLSTMGVIVAYDEVMVLWKGGEKKEGGPTS